MTGPLVTSGADWTFDKLYQVNEEIEKIAFNDMGIYDIYTNQVEVITAEQMLDAYSSIGMPIYYRHWSFGKHYLRTENLYKAGMQGLAYEIVINSNPCIVYIMEQNTLVMQTLVLAHAGIGHNHFFKNNYLFKDRTDASNIENYLMYGRKFVEKCEEKYGLSAVEKTLDAAHALMQNSVFKYKRKEELTFKKEMERRLSKISQRESDYNEIWSTLPNQKQSGLLLKKDVVQRMKRFNLPEENILYFIEKYSPKLPNWKRELLRIVRNISEYFYPQAQTKIMNEGCATWTHYNILNRLYDKNIIDDGGMIEFLKSHSSVVMQPNFNSRYYSGINPYSIGFEMMNDIIRIAKEPTAEDKYWFPDIAGVGDELNLLKDIWANYRDESFIRQFLSPHLIRKYRFFLLDNKTHAFNFDVKSIHNERGYEGIRNQLANEHDVAHLVPNINVIDVNLEDDRELILEYESKDKRILNTYDAEQTVQLLANLWGYNVRLKSKIGGAISKDILKSPDGYVEEREYDEELAKYIQDNELAS